MVAGRDCVVQIAPLFCSEKAVDPAWKERADERWHRALEPQLWRGLPAGSPQGEQTAAVRLRTCCTCAKPPLKDAQQVPQVQQVQQVPTKVPIAGMVDTCSTYRRDGHRALWSERIMQPAALEIPSTWRQSKYKGQKTETNDRFKHRSLPIYLPTT